MKKSELRKLFLQRRKDLSAHQAKELAIHIVRNFSYINFGLVRYLHIYYPIVGKSEFDTLLLVDWIKTNHPEIKLVLSKSDISNNTLVHYLWDETTRLSMNQWGITEPEDGILVRPGQLDMVVVPLLAFDKKGNRVGYGKGFYDRFLTDCRADVQKIGISYFPPADLIEDVNEHDIPLDLCVTPEKIWEF